MRSHSIFPLNETSINNKTTVKGNWLPDERKGLGVPGGAQGKGWGLGLAGADAGGGTCARAAATWPRPQSWREIRTSAAGGPGGGWSFCPVSGRLGLLSGHEARTPRGGGLRGVARRGGAEEAESAGGTLGAKGCLGDGELMAVKSETEKGTALGIQRQEGVEPGEG